MDLVIVEKLIELVNRANCKPWDVFTNEHGTITAEWMCNNNKLSIEIGKNNYSYFIKTDDKDPVLKDGRDFEEVTSRINFLIAELG